MSFLFPQHVRPRFRQALAGLFWILLLVPVQSQAAGLDVLLVLSGDAKPYQEFAATYRQNLPAGIDVIQLENMEGLPEAEKKAGLIVTVGVRAGEWVASHTEKPVLAAMLPSYKYDEIRAQHHSGAPFSAIFVDQPWTRQVSLIRAALPGFRKIGVLRSPDDGLDMTELHALLRKQGDVLVERVMEPDASLFTNLSDVLSQSDVLLAMPDGAIYNGSNIRNILLSSYRQRVPLIGLSQAYVNAGALCAVYSTPEDLALQASAATAGFARNRRLPGAQFPRFYSVAVNREVAMMLGIRIHSAEQLKQQIEQAEK